MPMMPDTQAGAQVSGEKLVAAEAKAIIADLQAQMREIADEAVFGALRNKRPGGADSWDFNASAASATVPAGIAFVPYPAEIARVEIGGLPAGSVTVAVYVARPGYALTTATLRMTASMTGATIATVLPTSGTVTAIEAGSWVLVYVTAMTTTTLACGAVIVRCL